MSDFQPVDLPPGPIPWADLAPYERQQGGYWLYGTDPYGADKRFVRVQKPPPPMDRPVRANDVEVEKIHRARCRLDGCRFVGEDRSTYQAANDDRQAHLTWHRLGQPDPAQETT